MAGKYARQLLHCHLFKNDSVECINNLMFNSVRSQYLQYIEYLVNQVKLAFVIHTIYLCDGVIHLTCLQDHPDLFVCA
jgi:hypothetical protein